MDDHPPLICTACGVVHENGTLKGLEEMLAQHDETVEALQANLVSNQRKIAALKSMLAEKRDSHPKREEVLHLFGRWNQLCRQNRCRECNGERFDKPAARLQAGTPAQEIEWAIQGYAARPYITGPGKRSAEGNRNQRFDELDLICRDEKHVEEGIALYLEAGMEEDQKMLDDLRLKAACEAVRRHRKGEDPVDHERLREGLEDIAQRYGPGWMMDRYAAADDSAWRSYVLANV